MAAFGYVRKSVMVDAAKTLSPQVQRERVTALAAAHGDADIVILEDLDISGAKVEGRLGYLRLVEAVESGEATAVYAFDLSRLHRNTKEALRFFEMAEAHNVPVSLVEGNVDTRGATGKLILTVLAAMNAWYSGVASEKIKLSLAMRSANGLHNGSRFYGTGEGDDPEAVLAAFREGGSYRKAAQLLNERGVPTRYAGKRWWPGTVRMIVRHLDPTAPVRTSKGAAAGGSGSILGRLLICPTCGTFLSPSTVKGYRYLTCTRGNSLCPHERASVSEARVLALVKAEVAHLATPETVMMADEGKAERAALEARRLRVLDMYESGLLDKAERDRRLRAVSDGLGRLSARQEVVELPAIDWTWPPAELNKVLRVLFERIDLDPLTFAPVRYVWTVPEWRA
jgi:DNA invertase Pin-like site-specific DNA recombinase